MKLIDAIYNHAGTLGGLYFNIDDSKTEGIIVDWNGYSPNTKIQSIVPDDHEWSDDKPEEDYSKYSYIIIQEHLELLNKDETPNPKKVYFTIS